VTSARTHAKSCPYKLAATVEKGERCDAAIELIAQLTEPLFGDPAVASAVTTPHADPLSVAIAR
jgi:hypothetical protein